MEFTPFPKTLEYSKQIMERLLSELSDDDVASDILAFTINVQTGLVASQFAQHAALTEFWNTVIRPKSALTQFVLNYATQLRFIAGYDNTQWTSLLEVLAGSCCLAGAKSCLDTTIAERAVSAEEIQALLKDNSWAVAVLIMSMTPRLPRLKR